MITDIARIVFWCCAAIFLYIVIGHGLLVALLRFLIGKPVKKEPLTPNIVFIIPAYNEAENIMQKLENTLSLDYPEDKLTIVVVSDASTDRTNETVEGLIKKHKRIHPITQSYRQGRTAAINAAVKNFKADFYALSDADILLGSQAIKEIVKNFADPTVGVAVARFVKLDAHRNPTFEGIKSYWDYEQWIHLAEMEIISIPFMGGNLSVVRAGLMPQVPPDVTHDHYVPAWIAAKGFKSVYDPEAITYEYAARTAREETLIRARNFLMGTNFLRELPKIGVLKKRPWFFINLFLRKVLRWFSPLFLILALVAAMLLIPEPAGFVFLVTTGLLTVATLVMLAFKSPPGWLSTVGFFLLSQVGLVWGIASYILGKRIRYWNPPR